MAQRTTQGSNPGGQVPGDDVSPSRPADRRAPEADGLDAKTRDLLRTLARKGEEPAPPAPPAAEGAATTLELLQALARTSDGGQAPPAPGAQADAAHRPAPSAYPAAMRRGTAAPARPGRRGFAAMISALTFGNRGADAARPAARRARSRWTVPIVISGCCAIVAAGAAAFLWSRLPDRQDTPASEPQAEIAGPVAVPSAPPAAPATQARPNLQAIQSAMAECDSEAQKDPDTLYFLVTPIMRISDAPQWTVHQWEDYSSFLLLASNAMLEGLRDGLFTVNTTPFRFAIIDSATSKTQTWDAATGVSKFVHKEEKSGFEKFRLGFDVPGKGPQFSNEYPRRPGVCYWVNVRFHW